ncbi:unnamed protein product [Pleuronectes platessa]|uniref:Uncharacterized protein n=1 Tax=Pleuronectes platessa TaxID=8262 RepID=A0A9N7Z4J4_PLEPL|nr:unnamed protein product [Pleuronectes platessa]
MRGVQVKLKIAAGLVISSKRSGEAARVGQQRKAVVVLGRSQVQMCEDQTVGHVKRDASKTSGSSVGPSGSFAAVEPLESSSRAGTRSLSPWPFTSQSYSATPDTHAQKDWHWYSSTNQYPQQRDSS